MKRKILVLALVAILASITAAGTLAYYSAQERSYNVITTSDVQVEVVEKTRDESGKLIDFPEDGVLGVMPGRKIVKQVSVKNCGGGEAWIRVKLEVVIRDSEGNLKSATFGASEIPVMSYSILRGWSDGGDGYYYYDAALASGQTTELVIDTVSFSSALGNDYQDCKAELIVTAQAVQTANNGTAAMTAKGWPAD